MDRTGAAPLSAQAQRGLEPQCVQHLPHGDLGLERAEVDTRHGSAHRVRKKRRPFRSHFLNRERGTAIAKHH